MTMRKLLATEVKTSPAMQAIIARRFYAAGSLGRGQIPADPAKPFVVFREMDTLAVNVAKDTSPNVGRKVFQCYVHDERGSYSRIDQIIAILRETVRGLTDKASSTGARCLEAEWNGTSGDTEDPTYDSNLKVCTFSLVSSQ